MRTPKHLESAGRTVRLFRSVCVLSLFVALVAAASTAAIAQPSTDTSTNVSFAIDALIIPMDNDKQGDASGCNGPDFNLRAYGLVVTLLHNNIPVRWAIANKTNKDAADFSVNAARIRGQSCGPAGSNTPFAGGPFIIDPEYRAAALTVIDSFNSPTNNANDVRVYEADAAFTAPIRYTLNHKPKIAVGPVDGGWGGTPHETLFAEAGISGAYWDPVNDNTIDQKSCYTIATQAHATSALWATGFRNFVNSGGNFLIQCESITHYEDNAPIRYQTSLGFDLFGASSQFPSRPDGTNNTTMAYDNPAMAFNQFVGGFAGDVGGAVSEFAVTGGAGNLINNARSAVRNNNTGWDNTHVAIVSRAGTEPGGGHVFTLGGHDYYRGTTPEDANLERRNAQRLILNAILIPSRRPNTCGLLNPLVRGYKSVETHFGDPQDDVAPVNTLNVYDTVTWTVNYINGGLVPIFNFQIQDSLQTGLLLSPKVTPPTAAVTVSTSGIGTTAFPNGAYNGTSNTNLLAPGAFLPPGGRITVRIRTKFTTFATYLNHPTAFGIGMPSGGVKTDTVDSNTPGSFGGYPIQCPTPNCVVQDPDDTSTALDPTRVDLSIVTAAGANIDGRVQQPNGIGIRGAMLTLVDAETGEIRSAISNSFGYFRLEDVPVGRFYVLTVSSKRHQFANPTQAFVLNDNASGIDFTADEPNSGSRPTAGGKGGESIQDRPKAIRQAKPR